MTYHLLEFGISLLCPSDNPNVAAILKQHKSKPNASCLDFLYSQNMSKVNPDETIGQTLQGWRQRRSLSQKELMGKLKAAGLAWSQTTLSQVEGGTRSIRLNEVPAIADALDIAIDDLLPSSSFLGRHLKQVFWMERAAYDEKQDSQFKYDVVRKYRTAIEFLCELAAGGKGPYTVDESAARFLASRLSDGLGRMELSPDDVLIALGVPATEIEQAISQAKQDAEMWAASGESSETLNGMLPKDEHISSREAEFTAKNFSDKSRLERATRDLQYAYLGKLMESRFPQVEFIPTVDDAGISKDLTITGLAEPKP